MEEIIKSEEVQQAIKNKIIKAINKIPDKNIQSLVIDYIQCELEDTLFRELSNDLGELIRKKIELSLKLKDN